MVGLIWFWYKINPSSGLNSGSKLGSGSRRILSSRLAVRAAAIFWRSGFYRARDMNEKDFGFERFFVSIFHGLEIDVITEIAMAFLEIIGSSPDSARRWASLRKLTSV